MKQKTLETLGYLHLVYCVAFMLAVAIAWTLGGPATANFFASSFYCIPGFYAFLAGPIFGFVFLGISTWK
jgi:hypothetical protein